MVKAIRKKAHSAEFKFKVAVAAIKGEKTMPNCAKNLV
jgi:hypothetical protein